MSAIPGDVETDKQPPMIVPLRHFVVGLGFLLAGGLLGIGSAMDLVPGLARLAHVHLLLVGWVCLTIMGAMTQFVPVWSNAALHSRRLANAQLLLVAAGVLGMSAAFALTALPWLPVFGAVMLLGFWTFVYNIARTLATVDSYDVTERHFLLALGFFLLLTVAGLLLAINLSGVSTLVLPVTHTGLVGAHVTLAVFGAVMTTIYGAVYQLGTMFTQTELDGIDTRLQSVEEVGHPSGVVVLALGRLTGSLPVARIGGLLVLAGAVAVGAILVRKLFEMRVEWTPMHSRYAVFAPALVLWAVLSLPAWLRDPTARDHLFGAAGSVHLLALGVVGFIVVGTLYHVIPFIIWVNRYSGRLGLEPVPMIDDLYDDRLAAVDFGLILGGTAVLVAADRSLVPAVATGVGGALVALGTAVFAANMLLTIRNHSPYSLHSGVFGSAARGEESNPTEASE
jgi:hypothetical protein